MDELSADDGEIVAVVFFEAQCSQEHESSRKPVGVEQKINASPRSVHAQTLKEAFHAGWLADGRQPLIENLLAINNPLIGGEGFGQTDKACIVEGEGGGFQSRRSSLGDGDGERAWLPSDQPQGDLPENFGGDGGEQTLTYEIASGAEVGVGEPFEVRREGIPIGSGEELLQTSVDGGMIMLVQ